MSGVEDHGRDHHRHHSKNISGGNERQRSTKGKKQEFRRNSIAGKIRTQGKENVFLNNQLTWVVRRSRGMEKPS